MNPFWASFFGNLKHPQARLFVLALGAFFSLLVLGRMLLEALSSEHFLLVLAGLGLLAVSLTTLAARRARPQAGGVGKFPREPLSRDELRVARSKLLKDRNRMML